MKRDMDLIRSILLKTEENPSPDEAIEGLEIEGYDEKTVAYHVQLLARAGLLIAEEAQAQDLYEWHPIALTWEGHDFLESIRDPATWRKTRDGALAAGGWTFDLLKDLAKAFAKNKIEEHTGVKL